MAISDVDITEGSGTPIAVDPVNSRSVPVSKMMIGNTTIDDGLVSSSNPIPIEVSNNSGGPIFDAFNRLRVSNNTTLFSSKLIYDKDALHWGESITNGSGNASSSHSITHARVRMSVESGDTIIRQTKQWFNYQSGKSQLILLTSLLGSKTTGVTKRVGYFNSDNGVFFEQDASNLKIVQRKNETDTAVDQGSWNIDTMDGNGNSGITIDETKTQVFIIDFQWLGIGRIRYGFIIDGKIYYCHETNNANNLDAVYMSTPNLPVRYEIASISGSSSLDQICSSVMSEGGAGEDSDGILHAKSTGNSAISLSASGTNYPLIGVRLKNTHLGATVIFQDISALSTTNDNFLWTLCYNPTLSSGLTYSDYSTESGLQTAIGNGIITCSDFGTIIEQGYAAAKASITGLLRFNNLRLGSAIDGTTDEMVLVITPLGPNADLFASIGWREIY